MLHAILLVGDHRGEIDILHTAENIFLNVWILFAQLTDQLFDLGALGALFLATAACAVLGKPAGTLDKVQIVVIHPVDDILLAHQIQWADQFHPWEVRTVQLRHHRLDLRTV